MRVGDDTIAEVRSRANIVEVISRYAALRRTGRNHMGICPFHGEKTPSFSVSEERGFFHCFGCGASGDVFKFLMRIENLTFPEALERLARECGVELPKHGEDPRRREGRERLLRANQVAAEFFQRSLWEARAGEPARAYLEKREIRDETARAFGLGYAPGEGLARALEVARLPLGEAETLGLVGRSRSGSGWYDRFRHRLVFPITDLSGKVIAFGGRLLEAVEGQPKYLNSPESPLFQKRRSLFGLAAAREAIRKAERALVVEGYVDVIMLAQAGVANAVAPLGTALTADQLRLLRRFTDAIVVVFDGDAAGAAAAARSFAAFAEVGLFADAAFLPAEHDPDSFVRAEGRAGIERILAAASPLVDHHLRSLAPAGAALAERLKGAESVAELIARSQNPLFAGLLARRAAEHFGIGEEQLLKRSRGAAASGPRPAAPTPAAPRTAVPAPKPAGDLPPHEARVIELVLYRPELARSLPASVEELFSSEQSRSLFRRAREPGVTLEELLDELPPASRSRAARALLGDEEIYGEPEQMLADCLARIEAERREGRRRAVAQEIRDAEARGDLQAVAALQREMQQLVRPGGDPAPTPR